MAAKTAGDLKDPNPVWQVFKSVFKNLMLAKGPETDKYLNSISQMVTSFPQILVESSTWPESRVGLAVRRDIFTAAPVRRVVLVVAGREEEDKSGSCLVVTEAILRIRRENSPSRYRNYIKTIYL